jgi:hypothetical protein
MEVAAMFACIVVAFEIAVLGAAFWYVFLREEKAYKIVGDPWGNYAGIDDPDRREVSGVISRLDGKVVLLPSPHDPDEPLAPRTSDQVRRAARARGASTGENNMRATPTHPRKAS